jgi:hypothetical protein
MDLRYLLFVVLTLLLTSLLSFTAWRTARLLRVWRPPGNPLLDPADNVLRLLLILACIGLGWLSGLPPAQLGWTAPQPWRQVGIGLAVGLLLAAFFAGVTRWLFVRRGDRVYSPLIVDLITPRNGRELSLVALTMVTVVLVEELLFRSLLIGGFVPLAPAWLWLLAGSALFGLLHSPQGAWGMAGAALAGLVLGLLFVATGSLLAPCVAHYVANMVQLGMVRRRRLETRDWRSETGLSVFSL